MGFLRTPNEDKIAHEVNQVPIAIIEPSSSSDEEEVAEPLRLPAYQPRRNGQGSRRRLVLQALQDNLSCRNCKVGRRWSRRIDNGVFLQNLIKQGEDQIEDIIQQEPSVFEKLLCDEQALQFWEAFTAQSEEEQHTFLSRRLAKQRAKEQEAKDRGSNKNRPAAGKKLFNRICPLGQEFLNSEDMPKSTLLSLEPCLVQFFQASPQGQYVSDPLANDHRKVLHGLAQYLDLNSQSFNSEIGYDRRCTRVTNPNLTFTTPSVLLSEFLGIS